MKIIVLMILMTISNTVAADDRFEVTEYLGGNSINSVVVSGDKVLCASDGGVVVWNRQSLTYDIINDTGNEYISETRYVSASSDGRMIAGSIGYQSLMYSYFNGSEWSQIYDGSLDLETYCFYADSRGDFWVGTNKNWLLSYNGKESKSYSADTGFFSALTAIVSDDNGNIWLAGKEGVYRFDGVTETHFTEEDGLVSNIISCILPDGNNIWIGTKKGLSYFDGSDWKSYASELPNKRVNDIAIDNSGNLWVATDGGVSRFDGEVWSSYSTDKAELMENRITGIAVDSKNRVWFCSKYTDKGITVYENGEWVWYTRWNKDLPTHEINVVANDIDGNIWIGWDEGLAKYSSYTWVSYTENDGLAGVSVRNILPSKNGSLWIDFETSASNGISRYDGFSWQTYSTEDGFPENRPRALHETEDGEIWLGFSESVMTLRNSVLETYDTTNRLMANTVYDIDEDRDGVLWFGTDYGLVSFEDGSWKTYSDSDGLPSNRVDVVAAGIDGTVWCLVDTCRLVSFTDESFTSFESKDDEWYYKFIDISVDNTGILWAVKGYDTLNGDPHEDCILFPDETIGLYSYDGKEWKYHEFPDEEKYRYLVLKNIDIDNDSVIWCSTNAGLARYDGGTWQILTTDGPIHREVRDIATDLDNVTWFATKGGLSSYDGSEWRHYPIRSNQLHNGETQPSKKLLEFESVLYNPVRNKTWFFTKSSIVSSGESFSNDGNGISNSTGPAPPSIWGNACIDADGDIWSSIISTVCRYGSEEKTYYDKDDGIDGDVYYNLAIGPDNVIWILSDTGLNSFDGVYWKKHVTDVPIKPFYHNLNKMIVDASGVVWLKFIAMANYNIVSYDGTEWIHHVDDKDDRYFRTIMTWIDGRLLAVFKDGLRVYDLGEWSDPPDFDNNELNDIQGIFIDRNDIVWIFQYPSTISSWDGFSLNHYSVNAEISRGWYDIRDSYNNIFKVVQDLSGTLWVAGANLYNITDNSKVGELAGLPTISLLGCFPNPLNEGTAIEFELSSWGRVELDIYNVLGQRIRKYRPLPMSVGRNIIQWDGRGDSGDRVSSGPYFYRVRKGGYTVESRMLFVK